MTLALILQAAGSTTRGTADISWLDLALASVLVLAAAGISLVERLGLVKGFLVGGVRAVVQLVVVGYVLVYLFTADRWYLVLLALLVMLVAATTTATQRLKRDRRRLTLIAGVGILAGAGLTVLYVDFIVIGVHPWYDPRYLIPLFGMIVSNAMNGAALAAERLAAEVDARRAEIEAYLALGASPAFATRTAARQALTAALIPAINGLMIVGLVSLPGMMTGQILAGQSPLLAVRYQIVVAFMLTGATALTSAIVVRWYRTTFFTASEQLAERVPV
jgi:putative ABC transport system permease protein